VSGRDVAITVLERVEAQGAWASRALDTELERSKLPLQERALATEIVYGVLQQRLRLDRALERVSTHGLQRLSPRARNALRAAAYQLLFLDRVPAFAAVNETVERLRKWEGTHVAGFANAILRRIAQEGEGQIAPSIDPVETIESTYSLPAWQVERLIAMLGAAEAEQFAASQNQRPPLTLRINSLRTTAGELRAALQHATPHAVMELGKLSPDALRVRGIGAAHESDLYEAGLFAVQDEAAQLVSYAVNAQPGWRVLDACAGVGTKSTHLAALMKNQGVIDAIDANRTKVGLCRRAVTRMGTHIVRAHHARLQDWQAPPYDGVLLDAPCSGLGVLRHHPEAKWRIAAGDVVALGQNQAALLDAAAALVRPSGVLVYAVCTYCREETSAASHAFLERHGDFAVDASWLAAAAETPLATTWQALREPDGAARTWTHRHGCDTFYTMRFVRAGVSIAGRNPTDC
jgi:16S rRNA (cytosine967-C5)-methyltransferase